MGIPEEEEQCRPAARGDVHRGRVLAEAGRRICIAALQMRSGSDVGGLLVALRDGLDGLAIMPTVMVGGALGIFAYASGNSVFADYLAIPHLPKAGELVVFCGALVGAGLGFLWFNAYPAMVFMGDVGALALGAGLGVLAVLVRQEIERERDKPTGRREINGLSRTSPDNRKRSRHLDHPGRLSRG